MESVARIEVIYYRRKDKMYYAKLKCQDCIIESLKKEIIAIIIGTTEGTYIEYVSDCNTSVCYTLWGCKQEVKSILKRTKRYLDENQTEELSREIIEL